MVNVDLNIYHLRRVCETTAQSVNVFLFKIPVKVGGEIRTFIKVRFYYSKLLNYRSLVAGR